MIKMYPFAKLKELTFLELGKVLSRHALQSQFLAYAILVHKNAMPKTGLCGLKG